MAPRIDTRGKSAGAGGRGRAGGRRGQRMIEGQAHGRNTDDGTFAKGQSGNGARGVEEKNVAGMESSAGRDT